MKSPKKMTMAHGKSLLSEVKDFLRSNYNKPDGCLCPACGQNVKLYKRKLGKIQCEALILLNEANKEMEWVHVRTIIIKRNIHGDFAKMLYWGFIEKKVNEDSKKKDSGIWKITEKGKKFLRGEITVPTHAFIYNGDLKGFSEHHTDIDTALGSDFDYGELMSS